VHVREIEGACVKECSWQLGNIPNWISVHDGIGNAPGMFFGPLRDQ
jgi:hypothetical protein